MLEDLLKVLNKSVHYKFLYSIPKNFFLNISDLDDLKKLKGMPNFVFYKSQDMISTGELSVVGSPCSLHMCKLHVASCLGMNVGYFIETSPRNLVVRPNQICISQTETAHKSVKTLYQDSCLIVCSSANNGLLIMGKPQTNILKV